MKVSEDFDREYDQDKYERTIAKLVRQTDKSIRDGARDDYDKWWAAFRLFVAGLSIATCVLM